MGMGMLGQVTNSLVNEDSRCLQMLESGAQELNQEITSSSSIYESMEIVDISG